MATAARERYVPDPRRWRVLVVLAVALFMSLIDVSIVNVALPSIQEGLAATQSELQWVLAGYALTFGVGLVTAGRAGDLFGRGPLFILGVAVFTAASAWAGLAPSALWLNIARAVQGIGAGLLNPQAIGMIQQYFRGAERGRAFGIFGAVVGVSVAVGPLLGGLLIQAGGTMHGWRWVFFVNLPVGVLAIVLALAWIPRPLFNRNLTQTASIPLNLQPRDLDPVGSILLGISVLAILVPFVESEASALVWIALPVGVGLLAVWVWWERRYKRAGRSPMVDLGLLRVTSFSNGTLLVSLYFFGITSVWVLVALYMQDGLHHTALQTGLVGLPSAVLSMVAALWAGRNVARYGRKIVVAGIYSALGGLAGSIVVVLLHSTGLASEWWLLASLSLIGIAGGAVVSPNQALTLAEIPLQYAGSAGGVMQTAQRVGTTAGIAVITAVAFAVLAGRPQNWAAAFTAGFVAIGLVCLAALAVAYLDLRQRSRATD